MRCRAAIAGVFAMAVMQALAAERDFNGDGRDDVAWRHANSGADVQWRSGGMAGSVAMARVPDLQWKMVGVGDFDGDGRADLLWRHQLDGRNLLWRRADAALPRPVAQVRDTRWQVLGIGDFDGDGRSDILWKHPALGHAIWPAANASAGRRLPGLQFVAIADVDGDGRDDLIGRAGFYFPSGFRFFVWSGADEMRETDLGIVFADVLAGWELQAVGDFDGDGRDDLFWRNTRDGRNFAWRGANPLQGMVIAPAKDLAWRVATAGDYDGDGRGDLFWRHGVRGNTALWLGANAAQGRVLASVSALWSIAP